MINNRSFDQYWRQVAIVILFAGLGWYYMASAARAAEGSVAVVGSVSDANQQKIDQALAKAKNKAQHQTQNQAQNQALSLVKSAQATVNALAQPTAADAGSRRHLLGWLNRSNAPAHQHFSDEKLLEKRKEFLFSQLTSADQISLKGSYGTASVDFGGRRDEVISEAQLTLNYTYSPALIAGISHVRIYFNQELLGLISIDPKMAGQSLSTSLAINPLLFGNFNRLRFELIGHYTAQCEDPQHSSIWFNVSKTSKLSLVTLPLTLANELAFFPQPFFDAQDFNRQAIPFVFPQDPDQTLLTAAGITASWFGVQAQWRGVDFPVFFDELPNRHAIVFATNDHRPRFLANYPPINLPTVEVISHPDFSHIKLLLVLGRDNQDLITAARGIALGSAGFSGNASYIQQFDHLMARKPYDAPNWVRTDRPVKLIELVSSPADLEVSGFLPPTIPVTLHVPADLFTWRSIGIPIDLKFRYTPPIKLNESRLNIGINDQLIQSINLLESGQGGRKERVRVPLLGDGLTNAGIEMFIPAFKVGATNKLDFRFSFGAYDDGACSGGRVYNVRAAIDADTEIDFSHFPHYAEMPNLSSFANSGFPFTRMADLSETTFVLNSQPQPYEVEALLTILGTMAASTGYPGLKFTIANPTEQAKFVDQDLVVINALQDDLRVRAQENGLPVMIDKQQRQLQQPMLSTKRFDDLSDYQSVQDPRVATAVDIHGTGPLAAIVGFESPFSSGRSAVALMASSPVQLTKALNALTDPGKVAKMYGSVIIFRGDQVQSDLVGDTYFIGSLPVWTLIWYHMAAHPFLLIFATLMAILIIAFTFWRLLKVAGEKRLVEGLNEHQ